MRKANIRRALVSDAEQIAKVHIQSWKEAYRDLIPQEYLDGLSAKLEGRTAVWTKTLANPERWVWVAEAPNTIVGFVLFGPPRDEGFEGFIELGAIYLLAESKGAGIGFTLLQAGFGFMRSLGYEKAYCWVLEKNPTIRFYERCGASFLGQSKVDSIGGQKFKELAYGWSSIEL